MTEQGFFVKDVVTQEPFQDKKHFRKENLQHARQINVKEASIYLF